MLLIVRGWLDGIKGRSDLSGQLSGILLKNAFDGDFDGPAAGLSGLLELGAGVIAADESPIAWSAVGVFGFGACTLAAPMALRTVMDDAATHAEIHFLVMQSSVTMQTTTSEAAM